jgi:hypothetical protein
MIRWMSGRVSAQSGGVVTDWQQAQEQPARDGMTLDRMVP